MRILLADNNEIVWSSFLFWSFVSFSDESFAFLHSLNIYVDRLTDMYVTLIRHRLNTKNLRSTSM